MWYYQSILSLSQDGRKLEAMHHHLPHRLAPERQRRLPWPVRLDLELLLVAHHTQEPVMRVTSRVDAVAR